MSVSIKLPDGKILDFKEPLTAAEVAKEISPRLAKDAIAVELDGSLSDLSTPIADGEHELKIITDRDEQGLEILRHTAAHVLAQAVVNLFGPKAKYIKASQLRSAATAVAPLHQSGNVRSSRFRSP